MSRTSDQRLRVNRRKTITIAASALTAAVVGSAGCLDDDPEDPAAPDDEDTDADTEGWDDVDTIHLEGRTEAWTGVEPDVIEGEENPTIVLFSGQSYDISFENADGDRHNLVIWDQESNVVNGYETEFVEEEGEEASLSIEASEEMAQYVCEPHATTMIGEIEIVDQ